MYQKINNLVHIMLLRIFFEEQFLVHSKIERKYRDFQYPYLPCSYTYIASSMVNTDYRAVHLLRMNDANTLTLNIHTKCKVYITVYSWYCIVYEFEQTYHRYINHYSIIYFYCYKIPMCSTYSSLHLPTPDNH